MEPKDNFYDLSNFFPEAIGILRLLVLQGGETSQSLYFLISKMR